VRFHTDEKGWEDRSAAAVAFVLNILDEGDAKLQFGIVDAAAPASKISVELSSHDSPDFRITSILQVPDWLDVRLNGNGRTIDATVKPDAGWGIHADYIRVAVNSPQQSQVWVSAQADVRGAVIPSSNPYELNLLRVGNTSEFRIPLRSRTGEAFKVGKVTLEGVEGTTRLDPCGEGCQMLVLAVTERKTGPIKGHVWVDFPDLKKRLDLAVWGLTVPKDLQVRKIDQEALSKKTEGNAGGVESGGKINLELAVRNATNVVPSAAPSGDGPLLKWSVANGTAVHGFQIFRALREEGPFVLLNPKTIPSVAKSTDRIDYQWRDESAVSKTTYWYYIGMVLNDGHKQQLTGPQKVVAK